MAKHKLQRFAEIETFSNVVQPRMSYPATDHSLKGNWKKDFFKNENAIVLELGCGRGEYTLYLAEKYPGINFIGIDIKGSRLWRGAKTAMEKGFANAGFLRIQIDHLANFFSGGEVASIWLTFPDPQPQKTRVRKRLTAPRFLKTYGSILKSGGLIRLKTDSHGLYSYSKEVIHENNYHVHAAIEDIYNQPEIAEDLRVKTTYENMFLEEGCKIYYLEFSV